MFRLALLYARFDSWRHSKPFVLEKFRERVCCFLLLYSKSRLSTVLGAIIATAAALVVPSSSNFWNPECKVSRQKSKLLATGTVKDRWRRLHNQIYAKRKLLPR